MTYEEYLESKGYNTLGDTWGRWGNDNDGGLVFEPLNGDNEENAIRGYQYQEQQSQQPPLAPAPAPAPTPEPVVAQPTPQQPTRPTAPVGSLEELIQQQGYNLYRPDEIQFNENGAQINNPNANWYRMGRMDRSSPNWEGGEPYDFYEAAPASLTKSYYDNIYNQARQTPVGQGINTFNEGNEDQKKIVDKINTGQLQIVPINYNIDFTKSGGQLNPSEEYQLRDTKTGEIISQQITAVDASKGIFNIVADDRNSSGYFNNYVSTDPKGFVNPIVSDQQSQYASHANNSLNFLKDSIKGILTMAAIAGTAGGAGAALGSTLGVSAEAGTAALNAGLGALKQGVDGRFDPLELAATAALSYAGAGGTDAATLEDAYIGQTATDLANSGGGYDPIAAIKDQAGANLDATYTPDSQYINQDAQGYESGLYPNTSVNPNLTVDDLYKNTTDLGGLDTPVQPDQGTYQMGQGTSLSEDAATNRLNKFYTEANPDNAGHVNTQSNLTPGGADANLRALDSNPLIPVGGAGIGGIELGSTGSILGSGQGLGQQTLSDVTPSGLKGLTLNDLNSKTPKYYEDKSLVDKAYDAVKSLDKTDLALLGLGASALAGGGNKTAADTSAAADPAKKIYSYGTGKESDPDYMLQRRINAGNVYSDAAGYKALDYAEGGEVEHFGIGGKISDAFTRIAQPIEKAVIRPIGQAAPFLKDIAPYAGIAAGAMMGNPMMAAGIGGIASGFGKPGGFNMKRALMGGIAAYGMSNLAGGFEAAGTTPSVLQTMDSPNISGSADYLKEIGLDNSTSGLGITTSTGPAVSANPTFRNPEAIQKGMGNLLQNSNTPEYKNAMSAFTDKAGIYNAGVPIVMGTTGVMGVHEGEILKKENDKAFAAGQIETDKYKARMDAARKRAEQSMNENPYMFAMGGQINPPDDQTGIPNQTPLQNLEQGGMYNYAQGGMPPRFLSGGGDGMSDSIRANIEGSQEARLADGEFVIPADVVSHLGNGSSKAGAKQLYDMMDRVRKARTGNVKQGHEIKPTKLMPV